MTFIAIAVLIPFITAFGILISPWWPLKKVVNRKKFAWLIGVSIVASVLACWALYWGATRATYFNEVWNFKITSTTYEELWTTEESRTEMYQSGVDSKGHPTYSTRIVYYTQSHGPNWFAVDEYNKRHNINRRTFIEWAKVWKNERETGVNKGSASGFNTAVTGRIFKCTWPGRFDTIYPYAEIHRYENKVRASRGSVFKLPKPTEALLKKYPRPADQKKTHAIIWYDGNSGDVTKADQLLMRRTNAVLGRKHEIHCVVVTIKAESGRETIQDILTAWQGPNKNELVIFAGIDEDGFVKFCEVHSWMDNTTIHAYLRDSISDTQFNIKEISSYLRHAVPAHWSRKHFRDFEYLQVDFHWGWGVGALFAVLAIMLGTFVLVEYKIFEEVDEYGDRIGSWR